jgi:hypothetical protein
VTARQSDPSSEEKPITRAGEDAVDWQRLTGREVTIEWRDEMGDQSAQGVLAEITEDGWAALDWGYAVDTAAERFQMYLAPLPQVRRDDA